MHLYTSNRAPNPRRVRWFLAEKGVEDMPMTDIDLLQRAHRDPAYVARAGLPNVPALTLDDSTTITESLAICRYLESCYPEPNLFGRDPKEQAVFEMWTRRAEMMAASNLMMAVRHGHPALAVLEVQNPDIAATSTKVAQRTLVFFDKRLAESEWLAGSRISMADGVLYTGLEFARMVKFKIDDTLSHVLRWQVAMRARPSAGVGG